MKLRVGCDLTYTLHQRATFLFVLKCIATNGQKILNEQLVTEPEMPVEEFTIGVGMNRFTRLATRASGPFRIRYQAELEVSTQLVPVSSLSPEGPGKLDPEAIPFLFPSRYCPSDQLRQQAGELFGHLTGAYEVAAAIADWIHENIRYQSGTSNEQSSALDTLEGRQGVCRDFAHLGIAFCRAMNLPARYLTCYAYRLEPPDFHACFEVFIDGMWYVFDATRLAPLNGLVRIATGRDAADAAVCTIFGDPEWLNSIVTCECDDPAFVAITRDSLAKSNEAIALL